MFWLKAAGPDKTASIGPSLRLVKHVRHIVEEHSHKVHILTLCENCAGRIVSMGIARNAKDLGGPDPMNALHRTPRRDALERDTGLQRSQLTGSTDFLASLQPGTCSAPTSCTAGQNRPPTSRPSMG